jgi:hypothetical protein
MRHVSRRQFKKEDVMKRMTRKTLSIAGALIIWMTVATCIAQAQPKPKFSFVADVPFDFLVGNRTLPPGRYEFQFVLGLPSAADGISILAVRSQEEHLYQSVVTRVVRGGPEQNTAKVTFGGQGDRRFLSQVWWDKTGLQLHSSAPPTELAQTGESEFVALAASTSGR